MLHLVDEPEFQSFEQAYAKGRFDEARDERAVHEEELGPGGPGGRRHGLVVWVLVVAGLVIAAAAMYVLRGVQEHPVAGPVVTVTATSTSTSSAGPDVSQPARKGQPMSTGELADDRARAPRRQPRKTVAAREPRASPTPRRASSAPIAPRPARPRATPTLTPTVRASSPTPTPTPTSSSVAPSTAADDDAPPSLVDVLDDLLTDVGGLIGG